VKSVPIQPIVLVGGRSSRFGRDKLREPVPGRSDQQLVDRPIAALREVFGPRVALVGECHVDVRSRADFVLDDPYPGVGPAGGILAALEHTGGAVFVLPGDSPGITPATVRAILAAAEENPEAWAVVAATARAESEAGLHIEPCIGVYRPGAAATMRAALGAGCRSLYAMIPPDQRGTVEIPSIAAANINTVDALHDWKDAGSI
jgi:molybdenum cofactor guanylyltransferase